MVELVRGAERGMLLVRAVGRLACAGARDGLREARDGVRGSCKRIAHSEQVSILNSAMVVRVWCSGSRKGRYLLLCRYMSYVCI